MSARRATRPSNRSNTPDTSSSKPPGRTHPRPNAVADAITTSVPTVVMRLGRMCRRMNTTASGSISFPKPSRTRWGMTFMAGRSERGATKVSIEQVLGAQALKPCEPSIPGPPHRFTDRARDRCAPQLGAAGQPVEARVVEAERIRLRRPDRSQHQNGGPCPVRPPPVRPAPTDAAPFDVIILAVRRRSGGGRGARDLHPRQRGLRPRPPDPQPRQHGRRVQPRRADDLEFEPGAAPDGEIRALKQARPW